MMDNGVWQEIESKRWTGSDKAKACKILEAFDSDNYIRQYDIQAEAAYKKNPKTGCTPSS